MKTIAIAILLAAAISATWIEPRKQNRLKQGEPANIGQFPYAVGLRYAFGPTCGAVIVGPRHILTEAWCYGLVTNMTIIAGCVDYVSPDCIEYEFENVWLHPNYTGPNINDVAIISVTEDFVLNDNVSLAVLSEDVIEAGTNGIITGWTISNASALSFLNVIIEECDDSGADPTIICSGPSVVGYGDFGSPLVVDGILAGIALVAGPNVDTHQRVSYYVPWIQSVIAGSL